MGSLGISAIIHHLYNFGSLPVFISFGAKRKAYELDKEGKVIETKYIDYTADLDERICDGYYFAQSFKHYKNYLRHPELLDVPPKEVIEEQGV